MTYTYNDQAVHEAVAGGKVVIRRPIGMSDKKWVKYAEGIVKALDNRALCTPLERGEAIHKAILDGAQGSQSMKLVDILARELKVWPNEYAYISHDKEVGFFASMRGGGCMSLRISDHNFVGQKQQVVTRAEWQAAVDALNAPKADAQTDDALSVRQFIGRGWRIPVYNIDEIGIINWPRRVYSFDLAPGLRDPYVKPKAEPKPVEWDGEGLPPVGIECEVHDCQHEYTKQFNGQTVRIVAHHLNLRGNSVAVFETGDCVYHGLVSKNFRPIRTAEQIAAEKRDKAISEIALVTGLRAGGGRVEVAMALYEAGYRKQ